MIMNVATERRLTFAKFGLLDVMLVDSKLLDTISSIPDSKRVRVDVGGGSVLNETRNSLARISLRWMIQARNASKPIPESNFAQTLSRHLG